jgi:putative endonuclease
MEKNCHSERSEESPNFVWRLTRHHITDPFMHDYFVYIVTNKSRTTLYTGVTDSLVRRVWEHRNPRSDKSFTARYSVSALVWFEHFPDANAAIACESRIKGWTRAKKIALIEKLNPKWEDLSAGFEQQPNIDEPVDLAEF